jgi:hypothetical protein
MNVTVPAHDDGLGMRKNSCDLKASGAFDIHEVRIWGLDEPLQFVSAGFFFGRRM